MRDGRIIRVQRNVLPDGGHASTYTDITELRRAEEALKESEEHLRRIVDTSPFGVSIVSRATRKRLYVNHQFVEMLGGKSDEKTLKWPATESYSDPSKRKQNWAAFERDGILTSVEEQRKRLDGTAWWCLADWLPIVFEGEGAVINWHYDITERKKREEARLEAESRFLAVVDASPAPITLKDREGRYILANTAFAIWMDTDASKIPGCTIFDFLPKAQAEDVQAKDRRVFETGKLYVEEASRSFPDGKDRTVLISQCPVWSSDGDVNGVVTMLTDITERKQAEEALRESKEQHRRFSEDVAHELRIPLALLRVQFDSLDDTELIVSLKRRGRHVQAGVADNGDDATRFIHR